MKKRLSLVSSFVLFCMCINAGVIHLFTKDCKYEAETVSDTEVRLNVPKCSSLYGSSHISIPSTVDLWYFRGAESKDISDPSYPGEPSWFYGTFTVVDVTFSGKENLQSVSLPNTMKESGYYMGCKNLNSINLPSGVTIIENNAFWGCESLKSVSFPSKLESIRDGAFKGCVSLKSVSLSSCHSLKSIGYSAFSESGIKEISFPSSLETIGDHAFLNCNSLEEVSYGLSSKLKEVGAGAFMGCSSLAIVNSNSAAGLSVSTLPDGVTVIKTETFDGCAFKHFVVPENVNELGSRSFGNCTRLNVVHLPASLTFINTFAFSGSNNINHIYSHIADPFSIDYSTFSPSVYQDAKLYVHEISQYKKVYAWSEFKHIRDIDGGYSYLIRIYDVTAKGNGEVIIPNDEEYDLGSGYKLLPLFDGATIRNEQRFVEVRHWATQFGFDLQFVPDEGHTIEQVLLKQKPDEEFKDVTSELEYKGNCLYTYSINDMALNASPQIVATYSGDNSPVQKEPYVLYNDGILTFYYDNLRSSRQGVTYDLNRGENEPGWYENRGSVTKAIFDSSFASARPTTGHEWFDGCISLSEIEGLEYLNTSEMTLMDEMFFSCSNLNSVDLSHFNTSKVTDMRAMFSLCSGLKSIDLSHFDTQNVENMGAMLNGCSSLTEINLSNFDTSKARSINFIFRECTNLKEVTLGQKFVSSGNVWVDGEFDGCANIMTVKFTGDIPASINSKFFEGVGTADNPVTLSVPELYRTNYQAKFDGNKFYGGYFTLIGDEVSELKDGDIFTANTVEGVEMTFKVISAKDKIVQVGTGDENTSAVDKDYAGTLTIPKEINGYKVDEIASHAFSYCNFSEIVLPSGLTYIDTEAFYLCESLKSIRIPSSLQNMSVVAFVSCTSVESIVVEEGNEYFDSREGCNAIIRKDDKTLIRGCKNSFIPSGVERINFAAFQQTPLVGSFVIPEGVTYIGQSAFVSATMSSISLPSTLTYIGGLSFQNCNGIESVAIPEGVTYIGNYAFSFCDKLNRVTIPASVTEIGEKAFIGSTQLKTIVSYLTEPCAIADNVFMVNDLDDGNNSLINATLYVPFGSKTIYENTDGWKNFKNIVELNATVGDVTGDGEVTKEDIIEVETEILEPSAVFDPNKDVNRDGVVNVADIVEGNNIRNSQ